MMAKACTNCGWNVELPDSATHFSCPRCAVGNVVVPVAIVNPPLQAKVEYRIVSESDVNGLLCDGWELYGSPFVGGNRMNAQAMIKHFGSVV